MKNNNPVREIKKLGFGLMRLPEKDGEFDLPLIEKMADAFLENGFSYFDTSPVYGRGQSESIFGKTVAARYPHDRFRIATKLPMWTIGKKEEIPLKFAASLKNLGVDYIDFYMLHGLSSVVSDRFPSSSLDKADQMDAWGFLRQVKAEGKVKYIGFSFHDSAEKLDEILTLHPEVDFVQLQINYADWEDDVIQSRRCYETARKHGVMVTVMEPCKGGTLIGLRRDAEAVLREADPDASPASWAIRFAASHEGIVTVLSGMSDLAQMEENVSFMKDFRPLSASEQQTLARVREVLESIDTIPCTGCGYCLDGCPKKIRIPDFFRIANNEIIYEGRGDAARRYENLSGRGSTPSDCIHCKKCENICPQHLPVTELLQKVTAMFCKKQ